MVTIDHVSSIAVSESDSVNELTTLRCLGAGISALAQQVAALEVPIRESELRRRKRIRFFGFGMQLPDGTTLPEGAEQLLPCFFHWFGTSLVNYARLVGYLGGLAAGIYDRSAMAETVKFETVKTHCNGYVDSISELASVKTWRNKVYAHFAITDPRKPDNPALLDLSVMSPIGYDDHRFRVGGMVVSTRGAQATMPAWSVTEVFEALRPRYWP